MPSSFQGNREIAVVGAGLAGTECALQLARLGHHVNLYEMRDKTMTPAHKTSLFGELVCSNSLGSLSDGSSPQQLKWEAEQLGSFILKAALQTAIPAGQALGVDRNLFANTLTNWVKNHPRILVHHEVVEDLGQIPRPAVIATGPLTHEALSNSLQKYFHESNPPFPGGENKTNNYDNFSSHEQPFLYFFDAIAPIVETESINMEIAWKQDRYDKGTADYINCPLNKDQYFQLIHEIKAARKVEPKHFEMTPFFEGCMPIETLVERGPHTLRFGPMKPVGLTPPRGEGNPYAVLQLRQDNKEGTAYNMVGFQTRMVYSEQIRVFRMIPGLEQAEFLKLGSLHRNLYINSPTLLHQDLSSKKDPWLFFAGQIIGVEGYFESACMGLLCAYFLHLKFISHLDLSATRVKTTASSWLPPRETALGSLLNAISDVTKARHFQPTNINFGLLPPLPYPTKDKNEKKREQIERAKESFKCWKVYLNSLLESTS